MLIRSLIAVGMAVGVAGTAGCGSSKPKPIGTLPGMDSQAADLRPRPVEPSPPAAVDPDAGTIDALTRKAQQYTQQLQPLVQQRSTTPPATAPAVAPVPSRVEWMSPGQLAADSTSQSSGVSGQLDQRGAIRAAVDVKELPGPVADEHPQANSAIASATPIDRTARVAAPVTSDALMQRLAQRIKDYPRDTSSHLEYQLLKFLMDEPAPQLAALSSLPPEDRELITSVIDGLINLRNGLRADSNMLLSRKIKPMVDTAERLRAQAELTIPTIALCRSVTGFGSYDPIDPARFPAGHENRAIVYCEIANFTSMLGDKQQWETQLKWDMTLYTEQGMSVWSDKTETIKDASRNRRHDFFVRKIIALPPSLTIGRYLLKVTIVDTQSNRVAEATTPIVFEAQ